MSFDCTKENRTTNQLNSIRHFWNCLAIRMRALHWYTATNWLSKSIEFARSFSSWSKVQPTPSRLRLTKPKIWFYRPLGSERGAESERNNSTNLIFRLPITICFNVNTWNVNFLVVCLCAFDFHHSPRWYHTTRHTHSHRIYGTIRERRIRTEKKITHFFLFRFIFRSYRVLVIFRPFHKERPICVIKPMLICVAWIETIYLRGNSCRTK